MLCIARFFLLHIFAEISKLLEIWAHFSRKYWRSWWDEQFCWPCKPCQCQPLLAVKMKSRFEEYTFSGSFWPWREDGGGFTWSTKLLAIIRSPTFPTTTKPNFQWLLRFMEKESGASHWSRHYFSLSKCSECNANIFCVVNTISFSESIIFGQWYICIHLSI